MPLYLSVARVGVGSSLVVHFCDESLFAGVLVLFLAFFAFLHCWLNAFAEMLRFADRMFYKVHPLTLSTPGTFKCLGLFHFVPFLYLNHFDIYRIGGIQLLLPTTTARGM